MSSFISRVLLIAVAALALTMPAIANADTAANVRYSSEIALTAQVNFPPESPPFVPPQTPVDQRNVPCVSEHSTLEVAYVPTNDEEWEPADPPKPVSGAF